MDGSSKIDEKGLGRRLQAARRQAGLTQQSLCQQASISYSTLAKIERGAIKSPSIFTIQSLVAALGVSMDGLLGLENGVAISDSPAAEQSKNGIEFVYFDVNGCLVHFFQRAFTALAQDTGASSDLIETTFWKYNHAVCNGQMSMAEFSAAMARRIGVASVDWEAYYLDAVEPLPAMAEAVHWAAQRYKVGLLTNTMPGLVQALLARGKLPAVDYAAIVDSSVVGAIKPHPEIFEIAATMAAVAPTRILLIDDDRPNIEAADKLGWHVLWCDDFEPANTVSRIQEALATV